MELNLPLNVDSEILKKFKEVKDTIEFTSKTCKGAILSPTGNIIWEESDEDYKARMNNLFYEVK